MDPQSGKIPLKYIDTIKDGKGIYQDGNLKVVRYDVINFQEFIDLEGKEDALVVVPVSPLEIHGKYLPLSADYIESFMLLELLKESMKKRFPDKEFTIVELPGLPIGTGTNRGHEGTLHVSRRAFRDVMIGLLDSLVYAGFRKVLLLSVHHGMIHSFAMEEAANKIMKRYNNMDVRIASPNHVIADRLFLRDPVEIFSKYVEKHGQSPLTEEEIEAINMDHHAGLMEISFVEAIDPKLVDPSYKECGPNVEEMKAQLYGLIWRKWAAHPPKEPLGCGYNANPSLYDSRDWNVLFRDMIVDIGIETVEALYDPDRERFKPFEAYRPWKESTKGNIALSAARVFFLGTDSPRKFFWYPLLAALIAVPWTLLFLVLFWP